MPDEDSDSTILSDDDLVASLRKEYDRLANRLIMLEQSSVGEPSEK